MSASLGELHPPYMNFMGPKTEVEDRVSLNYKGKGGIKRGTANYFLPTTHSDLVSFEHDLLYWSPNNIVRAYADEKFLKDVRSLIGLIGISGQYIRRYGIEGVIGLATAKELIESLGNLYTNLYEIRDFLNNKSSINQNINKVREALKASAEAVRTRYPNIQNTKDLPSEEQFLLASVLEKKATLVANSRRIRNGLLRSFFFNLMPTAIVSASLLVPSIYDNIVKLYEKGTSLLGRDKDYIDIQKRVDKVKDKYVDYLNIVGDFKDTPSFKSLVKLLGKGEGEKVFKIKSEYNKDEAKKTYEEFYDEFKDYMIYMNEKYKKDKDYEPFDIKELNEDNLNKVVEMENVPSSFYEDIGKWFSNIEDKDKLDTKEQKELTEVIEKSTTPSPTPEPTTLTQEPIPEPSPSVEPSSPTPSPSPPDDKDTDMGKFRNQYMYDLISDLEASGIDYDFEEIADIINSMF